MRVTDPTITTLTVHWNPADGNVQGYKVVYVPEDGGEEVVVSPPGLRHRVREVQDRRRLGLPDRVVPAGASGSERWQPSG